MSLRKIKTTTSKTKKEEEIDSDISGSESEEETYEEVKNPAATSVYSTGTKKIKILSTKFKKDDRIVPQTLDPRSTNRKYAQMENLEPGVIYSIGMHIMSFDEMKQLSAYTVSLESYNDNIHGINSPYLGCVTDGLYNSMTVCEMCSLVDCPGHYGLINFNGTKIYNPYFYNNVIQILKIVCHGCGRLLITDSVYREKGYDKMATENRLKEMAKHASDITSCPYMVDKAERRKGDEDIEILHCPKNPKIETGDNARKEDGVIKFQGEDVKVSVDRVYDILNMISNEDSNKLGFSHGSHPRNLIMQGILVTPLCARPPRLDGIKIMVDPMTTIYSTIVSTVKEIVGYKTKISQSGTSKKDFYGLDTKLYKNVYELIVKGSPKKDGDKENKSVTDMIQSKDGVLRKLMMGKRDKLVGRTVGDPGDNIKFGYAQIPRVFSSVLVDPIKITAFNKDYIKWCFANSMVHSIKLHSWPIKNRYDNPNRKFGIKLDDFEIKGTTEKSKELTIGDIIYVYMMDGSYIATNRQPSLHKTSIMAYKVQIIDSLCAKFHLSITTPYNLDFDGDEKNLLPAGSFSVKAEYKYLMNVIKNLGSSETNANTMGFVMNSITGSYLLSDPELRLHPDVMEILIKRVSYRKGRRTFLERLRRHNVDPFSGRAAFSLLLPPDFFYRKGDVVIVDGILIAGRLQKSHVGISHRSIVQELFHRYGKKRAGKFLSDGPLMISSFLFEFGFSIGIQDCVNLKETEHGEVDVNEILAKQALDKMELEIAAIGEKRANPIEEALREKQINNVLNSVKGVGVTITEAMLRKKDNAFGIMSSLGAQTKGDVGNIANICGVPGQQYAYGQRLTTQTTEYDKDETDVRAKGFVDRSLHQGTTPTGQYVIQWATRESISDTGTKTSMTGTLQRKTTISMSGLVIGYNGAIVNGNGLLFAQNFNSGYAVDKVRNVNSPDHPRFHSPFDICNMVEYLNIEHGWVPDDVPDPIEPVDDDDYDLLNEILEEGEEYEDDVDPIRKSIYPIIDEDGNYYEELSEITTYRYLKPTKFEKTRVISIRAEQLNNNMKPLINIDSWNFKDKANLIKIASKEYRASIIPAMQIIRHYPNKSMEVYDIMDIRRTILQ